MVKRETEWRCRKWKVERESLGDWALCIALSCIVWLSSSSSLPSLDRLLITDQLLSSATVGNLLLRKEGKLCCQAETWRKRKVASREQLMMPTTWWWWSLYFTSQASMIVAFSFLLVAEMWALFLLHFCDFNSFNRTEATVNFIRRSFQKKSRECWQIILVLLKSPDELPSEPLKRERKHVVKWQTSKPQLITTDYYYYCRVALSSSKVLLHKLLLALEKWLLLLLIDQLPPDVGVLYNCLFAAVQQIV